MCNYFSALARSKGHPALAPRTAHLRYQFLQRCGGNCCTACQDFSVPKQPVDFWQSCTCSVCRLQLTARVEVVVSKQNRVHFDNSNFIFLFVVVFGLVLECVVFFVFAWPLGIKKRSNSLSLSFSLQDLSSSVNDEKEKPVYQNIYLAYRFTLINENLHLCNLSVLLNFLLFQTVSTSFRSEYVRVM